MVIGDAECSRSERQNIDKSSTLLALELHVIVRTYRGRGQGTNRSASAVGATMADLTSHVGEDELPMDILVWIIIGLIAGGIASLIVPGRTPAGAIGAVVVGILGGLLGGWIFEALFDMDSSTNWIGSIIVAIIGAVIILYAMRAVDQRT